MDKTKEKSLKILLVTHNFFPKYKAGTEVLTYELAKGLQSLGHVVYVLTGERERTLKNDTKPWITSDEYDGITVYRLHFGAKNRSNLLLYHLDAPERIFIVSELIDALNPDIVHFHHVIGFSANVIPAVSLKNIPVVFTPTDYWAVCPWTILLKKYEKKVCQSPGIGFQCLRCFVPVPEILSKALIRICSSKLNNISSKLKIIALLEQRKNYIINCINKANLVLPATHFLGKILAENGVLSEKIHVVPYGIDIGYLPDRIKVPEAFNEENPLCLSFIGSISELKGLHVILKAISKIEPGMRYVKLDIYGKIDKKDSYFKKLYPIALELGTKVEFKGEFPHHDIGKVLRSIHMLVVPSIWYESTPLVLCSALNSGTPVIVSRLGGMTEVVVENMNGFTFKAGNEDDLAEVIKKVLVSPQIVKGMLNSSISRVRYTSDYINDIENEYKQMLNTYEQI